MSRLRKILITENNFKAVQGRIKKFVNSCTNNDYGFVYRWGYDNSWFKGHLSEKETDYPTGMREPYVDEEPEGKSNDRIRIRFMQTSGMSCTIYVRVGDIISIQPNRLIVQSKFPYHGRRRSSDVNYVYDMVDRIKLDTNFKQWVCGKERHQAVDRIMNG